MKIKKTVGEPGQHGKDYVIHTECGCRWRAKRNATGSTYSQMELGIERATLSEIKTVVERCEAFPTVSDDDEPEEHRTVFEQGPKPESLLAMLHCGEPVDRETIINCLDNAGYVDPTTREIDLDHARKDIEKNKKAGYEIGSQLS